jgi:Flp pilus assembly protein TadG
MNREHTNSRRARSQRGQSFLVILIFISVLLLGVMGIVMDYSQIWAHRQMAQGAADAACQAGAADVYLNAIDPAAQGTNGVDFSYIGTAYNCSTKTTSSPCAYAALNGYSGSNVNVSFPASVPGAPSLGGFGTIANPYIQVKINDSVPLSFTKLFSSSTTFTVSAKASCGLNPVAVPVPLVVLHPTVNGALSVAGAATIKIFGGPTRSILVNSKSTTAVSVGHVDLSQAGPSGTGADFAVFGGPATQPIGITLGTTGKYVYPAAPIGDPWVTVATPTAPATLGTATPVPFAVNGCPDPAGCVEFTPGNYTNCSTGNIAPGAKACLMLPFGGSNPRFSVGGTNWAPNRPYANGTLILPTPTNPNNPGNFVYQVFGAGGTSAGAQPALWNQTPCLRQPDGTCAGGLQPDVGVTWQNVGKVSTTPGTGIFDPGLYYIGVNGLNLGSNSTVRMSTATGDGNNGITFYFGAGSPPGSDTVSVGANTGHFSACTSASSGSGSPSSCIVSYKVDGSISSAATGYVPSPKLQCPGGPTNPTQVPASINGNILLGPCSGTYGDSSGKNRGFLFFQNHAKAAQPSWGGGGQFLLSGFMYFHSGTGTTCGTNTTCFTMNGGSGAGAFTLGNIVVDELAMTGNSTLNMILNPSVTYQTLKPQLLQ